MIWITILIVLAAVLATQIYLLIIHAALQDALSAILEVLRGNRT